MISVKEFSSKVAEITGDDADALVLIHVKGTQTATHVIGPTEPFIDQSSLAIAASLRSLLDEKFDLAEDILKRLVDSGAARVRRLDVKKIEETSPDSRAQRDNDLFDALLSALFASEGGEEHANDH